MITRQLLLDKANAIQGWMSLEELSFLAEIASSLKDNSIIYEIGSLCGRSSRVLADNSPSKCKIYCIDPWDYLIIGSSGDLIVVDETIFGKFYVNLHNYIESNKVIPITMKWEDFNPIEDADFIFIDGDHSYNSVVKDISKALMYIKYDGIIAGHDYTNIEGVHRAVNELFPESDIHVKDSIWWTRRF